MELVAILDKGWIDLHDVEAPVRLLGIELVGDADLGAIELTKDAVAD